MSENRGVEQRHSRRTAWAQVASSFFLMFNTWGFVNAYGVFQEYYTSLSPPVSAADGVAWIGSIQVFLLLFGGAFTGPWVDAGYARLLTVIGSASLTLGLLFTSFSGEFNGSRHPVYWQVLLSQGILSGLGMGLLLVPSTAIVPTYFTTRRALAIGVSMSGASIGGVVYPILVRRLLAAVGFHWALRAAALVVAVTQLVAVVLVRQRTDLPKPKRRRLPEVGALKDTSFTMLALGIWLSFCGLYVPYFYVTVWVRDVGISTDGLQSYYLLSIMNAGGFVGRILPGLVADLCGPLATQSFTVVACGVLAVGWIFIHTFAPLLVFGLLYGFFSGAVISLIPASVSSLTVDMSRLGGRLGVVFALNSVASLIGNPIAGIVLRHSGGGWTGLRAFCAAFNLAGGFALTLTWLFMQWQRQGRVKADAQGNGKDAEQQRRV